eukprot:305843-Pyramimonas_sp.AAC.1
MATQRDGSSTLPRLLVTWRRLAGETMLFDATCPVTPQRGVNNSYSTLFMTWHIFSGADKTYQSTIRHVAMPEGRHGTIPCCSARGDAAGRENTNLLLPANWQRSGAAKRFRSILLVAWQ